MRIIFTLALLVGSYCCAYAQLTPAQDKKGMYGFVDQSGKFVIKARYSQVGEFEDGIAWVVFNTLYGFIDQNGKYVVKPKYTSMELPFNQFGLRLVGAGGKRDKDGKLIGEKFGYIDRHAREVVPAQYTRIGKFDEQGIFWVNIGAKLNAKLNKYEGGKYGYMTATGTELTKLMYSNVRSSFKDGYAWVCVGNKYGYIDSKGGKVTDVKYDAVQDVFRNGFAGVRLGQRYGIVSTTGQQICPPKYIYVGNFNDGRALVVAESKKELPRYGYVNEQGQEVVATQYDDALLAFNEGMAAVKKDGRWAFINTSGTPVTGFDYASVEPFRNGQAAVSKTGFRIGGQTGGEVWAFINLEGKEITPFKYNFMETPDEKGWRLVGRNIVPKKSNLLTADRLGVATGASSKTNSVKTDNGWATSAPLMENSFVFTHVENLDRQAVTRQREYDFINYLVLQTLSGKQKKEYAGLRTPPTIDPQVTLPPMRERLFGWIDEKGEEIIPLMYENALNFSGELAPVIFSGQVMWINRDNETVLATECASATHFADGLACVSDKNGKWGCIDTSGNLVVPFAGKSLDEAREMTQQLYLPTGLPVTARQVKFYRMGKTREQDKYAITATIPDEMWDF